MSGRSWALRHRTFYSLAELNQAIGELAAKLNNRLFQKLAATRRSLFETMDRPALRPLPATPYVYCEWSKARVGIDYHVEAHSHYYSVPHVLAKKEVEVRTTAATVEIFFKNIRVASHVRSSFPGRHTTDPSHMPSSHRRYAEWTPARIAQWAAETGPETQRHVAHSDRHGLGRPGCRADRPFISGPRRRPGTSHARGGSIARVRASTLA